MNRADLLQRAGRYPAPPGAPADIPGLELAGEVAAVGAAVTRWKGGERVFGIIGGGAHAEFAVVHEAELARVPDALSWRDAAAVPEAFITAHDALVTQAALRKRERVVVHAVGSGVGLAAIQLVRAFGGSAFGTARTADKIERAERFGLSGGAVIDEPPRVTSALREWAPDGVHVAIDLVGGDYLPATVEAMAPRGRIILVGLLAGRAASLNLGTVLSRRLSIRGTVMRTRTAEEKAAATAAFERDVLPLLASGVVAPVIEGTFPLAAIADAHTLLESNTTFGKVVLQVA